MLLLAFALDGKRDYAEKMLKEKVAKINKWLDKKLLDHINKVALSVYKKEHLYIIGKSTHYPILSTELFEEAAT